MKKYILSLLTALPLLSAAQDAYTLKFLPQLQQSQWSNAASQVDNKLTIGLPVISGTSFSLYNPGFTFHSIFHQVNDSTTQIRPGEFISKLKNKNLLSFGANVTLLSVTVGRPDMTIGFSVNDKADVRFDYPKDLFRFLWYGNGAFLGQTMEIGNFGLNATWYREYALHATKNYKKWTFGISPKLLFGKMNISSQETSLKVYTEPDFYAITADAKMNIRTSGLADSTDRANGGIDFNDLFFNSKNRGFAIDLAAKYQYNKNIDITVGLNNLGSIKWNSYVHNYTAGPSSIMFDGFHAENLFQGDTSLMSTSQFFDSVKGLVDFKKSSGSYKTALPYELFAMANYRINNMHSAGIQLNAQRFNKKFVLATTLCYQINLGKYFTGALSYTARSNAYFNLGGALIVHVTGVQLYFATDNWWASIKPLDSKNTNLHMGLNVALGNRRGRPAATEAK